MSFGSFILRRVIRGLFTLWRVVTIALVALRLSGDLAALLLSDSAPAEDIARLRQQLGLTETLPTQPGFASRASSWMVTSGNLCFAGSQPGRWWPSVSRQP